MCESLEHLRIDAVREPRTPRGAATHPWLAPPVRLPEDAQAALATLGRQALHAAILGFEHPATAEEMLFESEPPEDFANLQAALARL